jgi:hypothetical protein
MARADEVFGIHLLISPLATVLAFNSGITEYAMPYPIILRQVFQSVIQFASAG